MSQNWRTATDAEDYFQQQQKQTVMNNRRPVIRKASDLVGPGIAATAVRITSFNDLLAQYNGFFSAVAGTFFAPTPYQPYVGWVSSDAELGGVQVFYGLEDGAVYRRVFNRNPADFATIIWGNWITG